MNTNIIIKFSKLKISLFFLPFFLLTAIVLFLYNYHALSVNEYIQIQKDSFLFINHNWAQYPNLQFNLTQLGDCLILMCFLGIFIAYAPKIWESLLPGLLVSALFSSSLKNIFKVPRPAAALDNDSFVIIGKKLTGFNSLPSGHSITVFTILAVLLFAFMPPKLKYKIAWSLFIVIAGLVIASTRVGVGAHYPIDVTTGCIIGYISGLAGIFISRKYRIFAWVNSKKYYPLFILLLLVFCVVIIDKIIGQHLIIFYLSLISLIVSLYKIISVYVESVKE
ncbi:MAG: phosphatase PAP2 family protein [Chitinophagaceae bacterium]|nr:phosphatase PAP2 family protein [Chitinophagaceae bacterium]